MNTKLPHYPITASPIHLTYRLYGSIPRNIEQTLADRRRRKLGALEASLIDLPGHLASEAFQQGASRIDRQYEAALDKALHAPNQGPYFLKDPSAAQNVLNSWKTLHQRGKVLLYACCVMSNHVHAILGCTPELPRVETGELIKSHKGYTARMCNRILGRTGKSFWDPDYFDRTIRHGKFDVAMWYVLHNPVKAGLVKEWWAWPFTYVNPLYEAEYRN